MTTTAAEDLSLLLAAAVEAGTLALDLRARGLKVAWKEGNSPVTNADFATDALLKSKLGDARPGYGWLSEETADDLDRLSRRRVFVVDPIDGTRAYMKDRPWWVISAAVVEDGQPIAGVVYAPQVGEVYTATAGGGAWLNGSMIAPARTERLEGCGMVGDARMFGHPDWPTPWPRMRVEARNSTAYRMCLVASGQFDAALALVNKADWDLAAADLVARESGAWCGDHLGGAFTYNQQVPAQRSLLCATPRLAPLIMDRVRHIAIPN